MRIDAEDVRAEHDQIGQLARRERALVLLLEFGERRAERVGLDRFGERDLLLRHPSARMLAVEGLAGDGGEEAEQRVQRRDAPVGAERQPHAAVEQGAKGVRRLCALGPDAPLRPLTVVDGVIRLHRSNDREPLEALEVFGRDVLQVLDAPAPLARAVGFFDLAERVEDRRDGLVADGVDAELQTGGVGADQPRAKGFEVLHLGGDEAVTGRVEKRLEKPRGRGPQRSVGVPFDRAEPQERRAERAAQADARLVLPARLHRRVVDARGQLAALGQPGVRRYVAPLGIHVLHAGDTERGCVGQRALRRRPPLFRGGLRYDLVDQVHRRVLEHSGRLAAHVAHDLAARRRLRLRGDAGELERLGIRQRLVAVVAVDEDRRRRGRRVDQLARRQPRRIPVLLVPVAAQHPLALALLARLRGDACGELFG